MQLTDYVSICALIVALVSLYFSARSTGFTKRTKLAELRATLLAKVSEASLSNARLYRLYVELRQEMGKHKNPEMKEILKIPEIEENQNNIDMMYKKIANTPIALAAIVYESTYHDLNHICGKIQALENRFISLKEKLMKESHHD